MTIANSVQTAAPQVFLSLSCMSTMTSFTIDEYMRSTRRNVDRLDGPTSREEAVDLNSVGRLADGLAQFVLTIRVLEPLRWS